MAIQAVSPDDRLHRRAVTWRGAFALFCQRMNRDARNWKFHLFIAVGLLVLLTQSAAMALASWNSSSAAGLTFLRVWGRTGLFIIVMFGISYFVQLLGEEKEQGTLGLLKLTGIGPLGILIGMFGSRLTQVLVLFTLQLPFVVWSVTLGGVTLHQAIALFVTLLTTLYLIGNLALFASVVCNNSSSANGACFLLLMFPLLGYGSCFLLQTLIANGTLVFSGSQYIGMFCDAVIHYAQQVSPYHRISWILMTGYADPLINPQVVVSLAMGLWFFWMSWLRFERFSNQTEPVNAGRNLKLAIKKEKGTRKSLRCWDNPYVWREFRFNGMGLKGVVGGVLSAVVLAAGVQFALPVALERMGLLPQEIPDVIHGVWTVWLFIAGMACAVVPFAVIGSTLTAELKNQTIGTLFLVSRPPSEILRNLIFGRFMMVQQLPVWFAIGAAGLMSGMPSYSRVSPSFEEFGLPSFVVISIGILVGVTVWIYSSILTGVAAMRLDFIKSNLLKGIVVVAAIYLVPIFIGLFIHSLRYLFFYDSYDSALFIFVASGSCFMLSLPFLWLLWSSTIRAIRRRMGES